MNIINLQDSFLNKVRKEKITITTITNDMIPRTERIISLPAAISSWLHLLPPY